MTGPARPATLPARHARTAPAQLPRPEAAQAGRGSFLRWPAVAAPLAPLAVMARPLADHAPLLQAYGGQVLGLGATLCLLGCLAVTPVTRVIKWRRAAWWRKWLGLCVFFTGSAGLAIAATGGPRPQWGMRVSGDARAWTGTVIVLALIPLALTSCKAAQKLLGAHWKSWQKRLTWAVWALISVHIVTLAAWQCEVAFFMASAPLLAARIPAVRKDMTCWQRSGCEDSARWLLTGITAGVFACGIAVLFWMEITACAAAVRMA